ncbi:MAG: hypothetical protein JST93_06640 [Acidobacteria bacterium]|nr:hypothetical protein [Acidobacteriota bacterium]
MTDWKLIAQAHGLPANEAHIALMEQLERTVSGLKQSLPPDMEPAPAFAPVAAKESQ